MLAILSCPVLELMCCDIEEAREIADVSVREDIGLKKPRILLEL